MIKLWNGFKKEQAEKAAMPAKEGPNMKILVPVDGSAYSLKAVETACDLAKAQAPSAVVLSPWPWRSRSWKRGLYRREDEGPG